MLGALRRRSRLYVLLALAGELLADSPTCFLVMAVTVPAYFVLVGKGRQRIVSVVVLAILIPSAAIFSARTDPAPWIASGNPAEIAVGRLVSGIRSVETGGQVGYNSRLVTTTIVVADARDGGWMRTGGQPARTPPISQPSTRW